MNNDVIIVGGGPVGLCLARALSGHGMRITVIEQQATDALAAPAFDGREIALTQKSVRLLRDLDVWERIDADARSPMRAAKIFNGMSMHALEIGAGNARSGNHAELGWLVANHVIRRAAFESVQASIATHRDITLMAGETVSAVTANAESARVTLASGATLTAALVIAADSRFSPTRRMMGIAADLHDFGKTMLVCRMTHDQPHREAAWEWFGYGQTLALLPMNAHAESGAHQSSVVLTLSAHAMEAVAAMSETAFNAHLEQRFAGRLGAMQLASTRHCYPLVSVYANRFMATRFATVGDAAVGMHPVTAHGFNFGLASIETLCESVTHARRAGGDIGAAAVLRSYELRHQRATRPLFLATRFVTEIYTNGTLPARLAREVMLRAASRLAPFRNAVAASLMG
ncbi:5-demethoxyubiquinol-8 5-hydroxylase UbiM [Paraburkholderia acidisoli]|uniref:5-demethoxyubiquinol-8 5-hydroxylase UbiM n=1 Tax=Paraburkholderia acidisoli TaxID=2571748 RepID=A0A7Z2GS19_9BURK|nr:5-demethoxyubiquinol-8 5-hydroxylase UbiM [Paraburkholderia acidisoli]QGZ66544.1 5-demethoxyubiquinol-8 5-hydroxylase UbiM [Paraburkholderia acidisoli]